MAESQPSAQSMRPRGMLLCAGKGTRLAPLTDHLPKPLIPVLNRPMLLYNLLLLRSAGVREVLINLHHLGDLIPEVLGDGSDLGLEITYQHEPELLGTGGGLARASGFLTQGAACLIANGDSLVEAEVVDTLAEHLRREAVGTMVLVDHPDPERFNDVRTDAAERLIGIGSVCGRDLSAPEVANSRVFSGLSIVSPEFFEHLDPGFSCVVRTAWKRLIEAGAEVYGAPVATRLHDCGTPDRLLTATRDLLDDPDAFPHAPRPNHHATGLGIIEPVLFGAGAEIGQDARVGPHVVLGPGAKVAPGVRVSESVVLPGATVSTDAQGAIIA